MALIVNILILVLEARGFMLSHIKERRWRLLTYYTQLSNMLATFSSLVLVVFGQPTWVTALRYTSACMLVMTAVITVCVLIPLGGDPKKLLWSGNGPYHHVLCPLCCVVSYVVLENHVGTAAIALPIAATLLYGIVLLQLNARRIVDGPYPFLKVHEQPRRASVLWTAVLILAITAFSGVVLALAPVHVTP